MAINSLGFNSPMRLTGLSSGMDTDSIIKNLMKIEQMKVNKQLQAKTKAQWKMDSYKEINKTFTNFRNSFMSNLNSANNIQSELNFKSKLISMEANSAVNITVSEGSINGNYTISRISQLAEGVTVNSSAGALSPQRIDTSMRLGDVALANGNIRFENGKTSFKIDGQLFEFTANDTLEDVFNAVSSAGVQMSYNSVTDRISIESTSSNPFELEAEKGNILDMIGLGSRVGQQLMTATSGTISPTATRLDMKLANFSDSIDFSSGDARFVINDRLFMFKATDTLQDVINEVNKANIGIKMSFDANSNSFTLETPTGADQRVKLLDGLGGMLNAMGFGANIGTQVNGKDALMTINGVDIAKNSNDFTIDGTRFVLKGTLAANETVGYSIKTDVDRAMTAVKAFVDGYNKMVEEIYGKLRETINRDYLPLTDEQRDAMTDKQIEKWEDLAKSGLLRNDASLSGLMQDMRSAFTNPIIGGLAMFDIGLQTKTTVGSTGSSNIGLIELNEDLFRAALESNPDVVAEMFTKSSDSTNFGKKISESGLAQRLTNLTMNYTSKQQSISMASLEKSVYDIDKKITAMQTMMAYSMLLSLTALGRYLRRFLALTGKK